MANVKNIMSKAVAVQAQAAKATKPKAAKKVVKTAVKPKAHKIKTKKK